MEKVQLIRWSLLISGSVRNKAGWSWKHQYHIAKTQLVKTLPTELRNVDIPITQELTDFTMVITVGIKCHNSTSCGACEGKHYITVMSFII